MTIEEFDLCDFVDREMRPCVEDCLIRCSSSVLEKIKITLPGGSQLRSGYRIDVTDPCFTGKLALSLGPGTGSIYIAARGPVFIDIRIWRGGSFCMGSGTTVNQARVICDEADVTVGQDGLWSDEILIQSNDQHGIVDATTGEILNGGRRKIDIGAHVWLGRRSIVMPDVSMGEGSILAAGSILTRNIPPRTIFGGVPAREIRSGVTWSRSPFGLDQSERAYLTHTSPSQDPM